MTIFLEFVCQSDKQIQEKLYVPACLNQIISFILDIRKDIDKSVRHHKMHLYVSVRLKGLIK